MAEQLQTYQNHVRFHPLFHYVFAPLGLINFIWSAVNLYRDPSQSTLQGLLIGFILLVIGVLARTSALKAQDRIIRLEEHLRYASVLNPELAKRAASLKMSHLIALRFASDAELPALVQQVLNGQLTTPKAIKQAIQNWRGDYYRV